MNSINNIHTNIYIRSYLKVSFISCFLLLYNQYYYHHHRKDPSNNLAVQIIHSENKFHFTVETTGSLTAKQAVRDAVGVLNDKVLKLQRAMPLLSQA